MPISGHKLITGLGVGNYGDHWEPADGFAGHRGVENFNAIVAELGTYIQYVSFWSQVSILWQEYEPNEPLTITNVSNSSPIEITTSTAHGKSTGNVVSITGVGGDNAAAANGFHRTITVTTSTKFTLDGTTGDGNYTNSGEVRTYDFSLLDTAISTISAVNGKGGQPLRAWVTFKTLTWQAAAHVVPPWAIGGSYNYEAADADGKRKRIKIWKVEPRRAWTNCLEAVISKYKNDTRVAGWGAGESAPGIDLTYGPSEYTENGYHAGFLAELEALRRGDPLGCFFISLNYYPGGWGGAKYNEVIAKIQELTLHVGPGDPIPYGKSVSDYDSNPANLHKGVYKWMFDHYKTHPMGGPIDSGIYNYWKPPFSSRGLDDPYPATAERHLSFSAGYVYPTPDTATFYALNYQKFQCCTLKFPSWLNQTDYTYTQLKQWFKEALQRYTDSFPIDADAYSSGAAAPLVTALSVNLGGPEYITGGAETFIEDIGGPTSGTSWRFYTKTVTVTGTTIDQTPYQTLLQLRDVTAGGYMEDTYSNLENGTWKVEVFYVETYHTSAGQRLFHFDLQGIREQTSYDIYTEAGGQNIEVIDTYNNVLVTDNKIVARWTTNEAAFDGKAEVFAIRLTKTDEPATADKVLVRTNIAGGQYVTTGGDTFESDLESRWTGGTAATRPTSLVVTGSTIDDEPYWTVRRGPTSGYQEAVFTGLTNGSDWTVNVYYIEYWWTAVSLRSFHLDIQGNRVQTDYDIYSEAGGQNIEVIDTHTGIVVADKTMTIRWTAGTAPDPKSEPYAIELIKGSNPPAEGGTSFNVQRGVLDNASTSATDTSFTPVGSVNSTLARLTGVQHTASGYSGGTTNQLLDACSAHLELTDDSTLTSYRGVASADTRLYWEMAEYIGTAAGPSEWIVRHHAVIAFADTEGTKTVSLSGVSDITKVVPFISQSTDQNTHLSTRCLFKAKVLTGTSEIELSRSSNNGAAYCSLEAIEFTGSGWTVQQNIEHTFTSVSTDETETVTDVVDWANCCIVSSWLTGTNIASSIGITVRPGSNTTSLRFRINGGTVDGQLAIAHIIKNPNLTVQHLDSITGGQDVLPSGQTKTYTVSAVTLAESMLICTGADGNAAGSNTPAAFWQYRYTDTTTVEFWRACTDGTTGDVVIQSIRLPATDASDVIAPTVPQNLQVNAVNSTTLRGTCDPSTDDESGVSHYEWELDSVVQGVTTATPQKDFTGLTEYTEYSIRVRAYDNAGNISGWSTLESGTTTDETPPANGSISAVSQLGTTLTFSLTAATDAGSGVEGYNLFNDGELYGVLEEEFTAEITLMGTYTWTIQPYDYAGNLGTESAAFVFETLPIYPSYDQGYDGSREDLENVIFDRAHGKIRGRVLHSEESFDLTIVHPYLTNTERQELNAFWESAMGVQVTVTLQDTGESHLCYMRARPEFIPLTYDGSEHSFRAIVKFIK